jgi:cephalosporin hydroxylase
MKKFFEKLLSSDNDVSPEPYSAQSEEKALASERERTIREFHQIFYDEKETTWLNCSWAGTPVAKCPLDLWVYQEIIFETKPDILIETGTWQGGSALYFGHLFDLLGSGRVISIDIEAKDYPKHPRVQYVHGNAADPGIHKRASDAIREGDRAMVILDSDHSAAHVARELKLYAPLVSPGCYLVVEDTNLNGNPVLPDFGPGPREALDEWLKTKASRAFEVDASREKFLMTKNPGGYLRRKA